MFSCMTPQEATQFVAMVTGPLALGAGLVAGLLVLIAQASRSMRYWQPASLGALMAVIVLVIPVVLVLSFVAEQYQRYR